MAISKKEMQRNRKTWVHKTTGDKITTGSLSDVSYLRTHGYVEEEAEKPEPENKPAENKSNQGTRSK